MNQRTCPNCNGVMRFFECKNNPEAAEHYCPTCHYSENVITEHRTKEEYDAYKKDVSFKMINTSGVKE